MSAIPKLRFPEFHEALNTSVLKDKFIHIRNGFVGTATPYYVTKGVPYIQGKDVKLGTISFRNNLFVSREFHEKYSKSILKFRDLVMVQSGHVGECAVVPKNLEGSNCHALIILTPNEAVSSDWVAQFFSSPHGKRKIYKVKTGNTIEHILASDMQKMELFFPSLPEQQKIASFLSSVDKKIDLLRQKKDALDLYKNGLMQKIFSQEIRFKQDDGSDFPDWEEVVLGDIAERVKTKNTVDNNNVLTISAQKGLVSQLDYFKKSVSSENLSGYTLLHNGDFAYNKSYSNGYPVGAIKRLNNYSTGVVSPLYICFSFRDRLVGDYLEIYLGSNFVVQDISKIMQEGARNHGLINISISDFFDFVSVPLPCVDERAKIVSHLSSMDLKIQKTSSQIEQMEIFKKGLLQQMFV
jgi:type I restriction enzyme S subunit